MTPTVVELSGRDVLVPHQEGMTAAKVEALLNVPGMTRTMVLWNGHEFEFGAFHVVPNKRPDGWYIETYDRDAPALRRPIEARMHIYYPVDPRTNEKDWKGATSADPNETNTAWLPAHCDPDHMRDREVELRAGLVAVLQPEIDKLFEAVITATDNKPSDWPEGVPWENRLTRRLKLNDIIKFRDAATKCLLTQARGRHIGWYHQNPDQSHLHDLVHDCITTVLRAQGNPYVRVFAEIRNAAVSLAPHTYQTRWEQEARKAAQAKAAKEQPSNGDNT